MGALSPSDSTVLENTVVGYDGTFSRCAMHMGNFPDFSFSPVYGPISGDCWMHFSNSVLESGTTEFPFLNWLNNSGVVMAQVTTPDGTHIALWVNEGGGLTKVATIAMTQANVEKCDLHINTSTKLVEFYIAGTNQFSATIGGLAVNNLASHQWLNNGDQVSISEVVVADVPTVGWDVYTEDITANGSNSGFAGSYTNINEVIYSDAQAITAASAGLISTFSSAGSSHTVPAGANVLAVSVGIRGKAGTSVTGIQPAIRSGTTNNALGNQVAGTGFGAFVGVWPTDPNTGLGWSVTAANAAEVGVQSHS